MKFELDCDYFNRAGDKVKYVGYDGTFYLFRRSEWIFFQIYQDGKFYNSPQEDTRDILGKWEITGDPDRVYVDDIGDEWRFAPFEGKLNRLVNEKKQLADYGLSFIKKILIKPPKKWDDSGEMEKAVCGPFGSLTKDALPDIKQIQDKAREDRKHANQEYNGFLNQRIDKMELHSKPSAISQLAGLIDSVADLKKIEPLEMFPDSRALSLTGACLKINELIAAHNTRVNT